MYRDVNLVDVMLSSFLGYEQHLIEQKQGSLVLGPLDVEGSLQNQFTVAGEIRTLPVDEQRLDLLWADQHDDPDTRINRPVSHDFIL